MGLLQNKNLNCNEIGGFRWWFCFSNSNQPNLRRFLKDGFSHVHAFCEMNNIVLAVEPMLGCTNFVVVEETAQNMIKYAKEAGHTVVCAVIEPKPDEFIYRSPIITCSSYLAYSVGLSGFCLTPYMLYKKLLSCGSEVV